MKGDPNFQNFYGGEATRDWCGRTLISRAVPICGWLGFFDHFRLAPPVGGDVLNFPGRIVSYFIVCYNVCSNV
jgi:hypothetical protein